MLTMGLPCTCRHELHRSRLVRYGWGICINVSRSASWHMATSKFQADKTWMGDVYACRQISSSACQHLRGLIGQAKMGGWFSLHLGCHVSISQAQTCKTWMEIGVLLYYYNIYMVLNSMQTCPKRISPTYPDQFQMYNL